jgi:hypothetical protein
MNLMNKIRFCYEIPLTNIPILNCSPDLSLSQWSIRFSSIIPDGKPLEFNVEILVSTTSETKFLIPNSSPVSYPNLSFGLIIQNRVYSQCIFDYCKEFSFHAALQWFKDNTNALRVKVHEQP